MIVTDKTIQAGGLNSFFKKSEEFLLWLVKKQQLCIQKTKQSFGN